MRYRETRNAPNLATLALVESLLMELAEKPTDSLFQYRSCALSVSQALPATGFVKPDAAFEIGKSWITKQWEESRQVIQHIRLSMDLQERYSTLLSVLPTSTSTFDGAMTTIDEEIASLLGLLALHRGEVVEISLRFNEWFLAEGTVPAIEDTLSCWCEHFFASLPRPFLKPNNLANCADASLWQRCRGRSARKEIMCCNWLRALFPLSKTLFRVGA